MTLWKTFCRILDMDGDQPEWNVTPEDIPYWTSLFHVNLLMELDLLFGTDMVGRPALYRSYDDIRRCLEMVRDSEIPAHEPLEAGVLFIGECCAKCVFLWIKQLTQGRKNKFRKALYYLNTQPLIDHLSSRLNPAQQQERVDNFHTKVNHYVEPWMRYLKKADTIMYSQIFQLQAEANLTIFECVKSTIDQIAPGKRWIFLPTPLPGHAHDLDTLNFIGGSTYIRKKMITAEVFYPRFAEVSLVDSVTMMTEFYRKNGPDSFNVYAPECNSGYRLDPFHYIHDFWGFLCTEILQSTLCDGAEKKDHVRIVPDVASYIDCCLKYIESLLELQAENVEEKIKVRISSPYIVYHAIKKLWYVRKDLRFTLVTMIMESNSGYFEPFLTVAHCWIAVDDLHFNDEQIKALDHRLALKTLRYNDLEKVRQYFRLVGVVFYYSVHYPGLNLEASVLKKFGGSGLDFRDPGLHRQLYEYVKYDERRNIAEHMAINIHQELGIIGQIISRRLKKGGTWVVFGAGALAEIILKATYGNISEPLACFSSFPHQIGNKLAGVPVLGFESADSVKPDLIVVGAGEIHYPVLTGLAKHHFPDADIMHPLFVGEADTLTRPMLQKESCSSFWRSMKNSMIHKRFSLIWKRKDEDGEPLVYSLETLIKWGTSIFSKYGINRKNTPVLPMILPTSPAVYALFYSAVWRGIVPSVLSYPTDRRLKDDYIRQLDHVLKNLGVTQVITDSYIAGQYPSGHSRYLVLDDCLNPDTGDIVLDDDDEPVREGNEYLFIQHSSGTTGIQKAVGLSEKKVMNQAMEYGNALGITERDYIASWLPLYHDMGLMTSLICPAIWGVPVVACDPRDWVVRPDMILDMIETYRATLTWWPNFTFSFLANVAGKGIKNYDLYSIRMIVNCSEPVTFEAISRFEKTYIASGIIREKIGASYAMAENTFAVSQTEPGKGCFRVEVDENSLKNGFILRKDGGKTLVSSGRLLEQTDLLITDEDGSVLGEGQIGELCIRSSSLFDGYHVGHRNFYENAALFPGGYHRTGDLGCIIRNPFGQQELFVTGRKKDMIIIAGENFYPQDIEQAVEDSLDDIRKGRIVAAGVFNHALQTESLAVWVETLVPGMGGDAVRRIKKQIRDTVYMVFGIKTVDVEVFPPGTLIKSSSGKIARKMSMEVVKEGRGDRSSMNAVVVK